MEIFFVRHSREFVITEFHCMHSDMVITNSSGPSKLLRYNQGFVITGLICVVKWPFGTKHFFVITECSS